MQEETQVQEVQEVREINLNEIYARFAQKKKERKELKAFIKDQQFLHPEYEQLTSELDQLKAKKKQIDLQIKEDNSSEISKLEKLELDIKADKEMLSDLAINKLMKNESVEIVDERQNKLIPFMSVSFKKVS